MPVLTRAFLAAAVLALVAAGCNRATEAPPPIDQTATAPHDDDRLATYVQARYQADGGVRASDIAVSAREGVVTLRGTVPDEKVREHAVRLARQVEGVRSVDDQLRIAAPGAASAESAAGRPAEGGQAAPAQARNEVVPGWITTKIQAQYFVHPEVKPWNIDVTTSADGVVTLRGEVEDAATRREAERIARETEGVRRVENRLRLRAESTARAARDDTDDADAAMRAARAIDDEDEWITAKVQAKYFMDLDVKGRDINVETRDGIVTLRGQVESEAERRQALAIARTTDGVTSVQDQLQVRPDASRRDGEDARSSRSRGALTTDDVWITTKVQAQYFLDPDIKGRDITVDARNGVIVLKGTVESDAEKRAAEQIARETDGVSRVDNRLQVQGAAGR